MDGAQLKIWREAREMTQTDVSRASGVALKTIQRAERNPRGAVPERVRQMTEGHDDSDGPEKSIPDPVEMVRNGKGAGADLVAKALDQNFGIPPEQLAEAMKRNPPYATTSAEAKAMRHARAAQLNVGPAKIRLLPLRPVWTRVGERTVNAAIPDPIDMPPPAWAGWRGVPTRTGAVYDYETAHHMSPPNRLGGGGAHAGTW